MPRTTSPGSALGRSAIALTAALSCTLLVACSSTGVGTASNGTTTPPVPTTSHAAASTSAAAASTGGGPAASCSPSGTSLTISAKNIKFSKGCLAAPANKAFTIAFDNEDSGVPHNIAIFTNKSATKSLFKGSTVTGPKTATYSVSALPAGTYFFRCDIHPTQMTGTFVVS